MLHAADGGGGAFLPHKAPFVVTEVVILSLLVRECVTPASRSPSPAGRASAWSMGVIARRAVTTPFQVIGCRSPLGAFSCPWLLGQDRDACEDGPIS